MDINGILDMEKRIAHLIDGVREALGRKVADAPSHAHIVSKSPLCATVSLSQCMKGDNFTPEYHIPELQSQAVVGRLESCNTIPALADAVERMMESGKVEGWQGRTVRLNGATLDVLRNSEVGRFVVDRRKAVQARAPDNS